MSRQKASREGYIKRFWARVAVGKPHECWPYLRGRIGIGYGQFYANGKQVMANRFAYEIAHGEGSADDKMVCHSCDNPPCCNPEHLFLGTALDNMRDKHAKGRQHYLKGDECVKSKLTEKDVRNIKAAIKKRVNQIKLAKYYDVTPALITCIKTGKAWAHVLEV